MAVGRDIYNDTRIMIQKLEKLFPASAAHPAISASTVDEQAVEHLLEHWTIDNGVFMRASQLIPTSMPLLKDKKFLEDRAQYSGRSWSKETLDAMRPEALVEIKGAFAFIEKLFADGRDWILKTQNPTLADIEGTHNPYLEN